MYKLSLIVVIDAPIILRYCPFLRSALSEEENISWLIRSYVLIGKWIHKLRENLVPHDCLSEVLTIICKTTKSKSCSLLYTWHLDSFERQSTSFFYQRMSSMAWLFLFSALTLSKRRGRRSCMTPALFITSMFCGLVAASAIAWTNFTRAFWYSSKCKSTDMASDRMRRTLLNYRAFAGKSWSTTVQKLSADLLKYW